MKHLRYDMYRAPEGHPVTVMHDLGITYQHRTPQSLSDEWWFWNCSNVPKPLPKYLRALDVDPHEAVGYGLSQEDADKITKGMT